VPRAAGQLALSLHSGHASMSFSFRQLCAWALLVLAISPFTPPFSTCDLHSVTRRASLDRTSLVERAPVGAELSNTIAGDDVDPTTLIPVAARRAITDRLDGRPPADHPRAGVPAQHSVLRL